MNRITDWWVYGPTNPNESVELKSTPCWLCGEVTTFSTLLPVSPPPKFSTTRDVKCASCAVGWRVLIRMEAGLIIVEEVDHP